MDVACVPRGDPEDAIVSKVKGLFSTGDDFPPERNRSVAEPFNVG